MFLLAAWDRTDGEGKPVTEFIYTKAHSVANGYALAYYKGDQGVFLRHITKTLSRQKFEAIQKKYQTDEKFRSYVMRYLKEYSALIKHARATDRAISSCPGLDSLPGSTVGNVRSKKSTSAASSTGIAPSARTASSAQRPLRPRWAATARANAAPRYWCARASFGALSTACARCACAASNSARTITSPNHSTQKYCFTS